MLGSILRSGVVGVGLGLALINFASAQTFSDAFAGFGSDNEEPIDIEASELHVEDNKKIATFIGDVVVIQGETQLEAQRLKVFYDGNEGGAKPANTGGTPGQQEISRIEAAGSVRITSKDQTATGDAASFDMKREIMIMTGKEVVLSQGPNVVVGNHLTVNLKTGQANLKAAQAPSTGQETDGSSRVKVRILPNSMKTEPGAATAADQ